MCLCKSRCVLAFTDMCSDLWMVVFVKQHCINLNTVCEFILSCCWFQLMSLWLCVGVVLSTAGVRFSYTNKNVCTTCRVSDSVWLSQQANRLGFSGHSELREG